MTRITHVELDNFKGQLRRYELGPRTLLTGPNGLGKSAVLEGLRYALSGEVPTGKALDEVAKYFPPRGGAVLVIDQDGNWIRRGIERDHEKAKVSEQLEEEGGAEWVANEALLDMREFLALSANKRREFVLDLVGAGETPSAAEVHKELALGYAREIGGPGADARILDGREEDLPEEIRPLAGRWQSVWGVLASYLRTGDPAASAAFQRLADAARERKNAARVAGAEARAAHRELEAAAKGAEAAAAVLRERRREHEAAREAHASAKASALAAGEVDVSLGATARELGTLGATLERLEAEVAGLEDPGPRPEPAAVDESQGPRLRRDAAEVRGRAEELRRSALALEQAAERLAAARAELARRKDAVAAVESEPMGRVSELAGRVVGALAADDCGPSTRRVVTELLEAVGELAESWRRRRDVAVEGLAVAADEAATAELRHGELGRTAPSPDACGRLFDEEARLLARAEDADRAAAALRREADERVRSWEERVRIRDEVLAGQKAARERWHAARTRQDDLQARRDAIRVPDVEAAREALEAATAALRTAEEAAGSVKAYRDAVARAEAEQVAEGAWKAAEAACKRARETYVADVVRPLVDDLQGLLRAAGRPERVYLELENERGRPVFDLGWIAGDSRRSLSALSGGEAVLFCAALAVTIARRSAGRKVLLIEADPLDEDNLALLLSALAKMDFELDAVLVATSTEVPYGAEFACCVVGAAKWKVIRFAGAEPIAPKLTPEMEQERERLGRVARLRRLGGTEKP